MDSVLKRKGEDEAPQLYIIWICRFRTVTKGGPLTFRMPLFPDILRGQRQTNSIFGGRLSKIPLLYESCVEPNAPFVLSSRASLCRISSQKEGKADGEVTSVAHHFLVCLTHPSDIWSCIIHKSSEHQCQWDSSSQGSTEFLSGSPLRTL